MDVYAFEQLPFTNRFRELIDGDVTVASGRDIVHQRTVMQAATHVTNVASGGEAFIGPIDLLLDDHNIPEPDILWLAPDTRYQVSKQYIMGGADLVIEVLSPGNAQHDRIRKFELHQRFGIPECWMLEPDERLVEVWVLREGRYQRQGAYAPGSTFQSVALRGATVTVAELFDDYPL
jgi:Uma2 family endonuclease